MSLITLLIVVVVLILVFWLVQHYIVPLLPAPWGNVLLAIMALCVIVWLLSLVLPGLGGVRVG